MTDFLARIASHPTLLAAFDRVRANHGCAGADGVSIDEYDRDVRDGDFRKEGLRLLGVRCGVGDVR